MKGILFTSALVFLAVIVLTTAVAISNINQEIQDDVARLAISNRFLGEISYVEKGFSDVLENADITASVSGRYGTVIEALPTDKSSIFDSNVNYWSAFVEDRGRFDIAIEEADLKTNLPIYFGDIKYYHSNGLGGNRVKVEDSADIDAYYIRLMTSVDGDVNVDWPTGSGNKLVVLDIISGNDTYSDDDILSFSTTNTFSISIGKYDIDLVIGDATELGYLDMTNADNLDLTSNITFHVQGDESIKSTLNKEVINITSGEYKISKLGSIGVGDFG